MYTDPNKYHLYKNGKIQPEGIEAGSLFDLQRSVPLALLTPFCDALSFNLSEVKFSQKELETQQSKWSSWTNPSYRDVIQHFNQASFEEKLIVYGNNIHITFRLYLEILRIFNEAVVLRNKLSNLN